MNGVVNTYIVTKMTNGEFLIANGPIGELEPFISTTHRFDQATKYKNEKDALWDVTHFENGELDDFKTEDIRENVTFEKFMKITVSTVLEDI